MFLVTDISQVTPHVVFQQHQGSQQLYFLLCVSRKSYRSSERCKSCSRLLGNAHPAQFHCRIHAARRCFQVAELSPRSSCFFPSNCSTINMHMSRRAGVAACRGLCLFATPCRVGWGASMVTNPGGGSLPCPTTTSSGEAQGTPMIGQEEKVLIEP